MGGAAPGQVRGHPPLEGVGLVGVRDRDRVRVRVRVRVRIWVGVRVRVGVGVRVRVRVRVRAGRGCLVLAGADELVELAGGQRGAHRRKLAVELRGAHLPPG